MRRAVQQALRRMPYVWRFADRFRERFPGSARYWERRYAAGGNSGAGSYSRLAEFKAEVLNAFVDRHAVGSVIEFGCGDGNQLALARYPRYTGLDVSRAALRICIDKFAGDPNKSFLLYDGEAFSDATGQLQADLALSLDVIYHLIEDLVFDSYMSHLFGAARRFVIIYSSDRDEIIANTHVRHRKVTAHVAQHFPHWELLETVVNRYPDSEYGADGSFADFFVYQRRGVPASGGEPA